MKENRNVRSVYDTVKQCTKELLIREGSGRSTFHARTGGKLVSSELLYFNPLI